MSVISNQLRLRLSYSRWLGRTAGLLATSGVIHTAVAIARGNDWSGAVSFRKPVTFAFSFALLLWACGWILDRLPTRPKAGWVLSILLIGSAVVEVGLITLQAWRGEASHFNVAEGFNAAVFGGMGMSILVSSVALGLLTIWVLIERPRDRAVRLGVVAGMVLVMAGLGIGLWIIELGFGMLETFGVIPDTVLAGEAGVPKFPHALALHGIQVFIGVAVVAETRAITETDRLSIMRTVVAGFTLLVLWAVVQANAGLAPYDLDGVSVALAGTGAALVAYGGWSLVTANTRESRLVSTLPS
jgi:hypothetical protein